jgi:hypothetical protein
MPDHNQHDECFQTIIGDIRQRHPDDDVTRALDALLNALWDAGDAVFTCELSALLSELRGTSDTDTNGVGIPPSGFIYDPD